MNRHLSRVVLGGALCIGLAAPAAAAVVYSFQEVAGDVVGTLSGTLDTTGLGTSGSSTAGPIGLVPPLSSVFSGTGAYDIFFGFSVPGAFGPGVSVVATSTTGDVFQLNGKTNSLGLPSGWTSGSSLSGTLTFAAATLSSLGITPGSYVYGLPNDTIEIRFTEATPVPEPATVALWLLGLGAVVVARRARAG